VARAPGTDPQIREKDKQAYHLRAAYRFVWCPLHSFTFRCKFHRGFVEEVSILGEETLRQFVERADEMFRPWLIRRIEAYSTADLSEIPRVEVEDQQEYFAQADPGRSPFDDATVGALVGLPQLALTRSLVLRGASNAAVLALAASPHLGGLTSLNLAANRGIEPETVRALLASESLGRVTELDLSGHRLVVSAEPATINPYDSFGLIRDYHSVAYSNVGLEGVRALCSSPGASRLEVLALSLNEIGDAGAEALLGSPYLARLERLTIEDDTIGVPAREELRAQFGG
jgi:hypothetical protein